MEVTPEAEASYTHLDVAECGRKTSDLCRTILQNGGTALWLVPAISFPPIAFITGSWR